MKKFLLAGAALIALSGVASAADLALKAPAAYVAPTWSWAGWYVGVNVGGGMALGTIEDKSGFFAASDSFHRGFAEVGGQIGYNWQFGSTVLGIEADWNWNSLDYTVLIGTHKGVYGSTLLKLSQFGSVVPALV